KMHNKIAVVAISLVVPLAVVLAQRGTRVSSPISENALRAHIKFLADDRLEGRGTGAKGGELAALYCAEQFEALGLKGAGEKGSYWQPVSLVGVKADPKTELHINGPTEAANFKFADDFVAFTGAQTEQVKVDAPLVFVGYGIDAPEQKWNDYKLPEEDYRGKILVMLVNDPPATPQEPDLFGGRRLTYYGRWTYKYEEAVRRGAVGVILVHKTDMASYGWEVVRNSWSGESAYLKAEDAPKLTVASWIQLDVARKLTAFSGMDLDKMMSDARSPDFRPVPLSARLQAHLVSAIRPFDSNNVIAMLPGSSPRLKDQAVLYTAHYDHLGISPNQPGDKIYNGANDNATGRGILLEIARAYSAAASKPARSILFASVTGEEKGVLGSEYLGKHPPIPAGKISLNLNFDDVPPLGSPEETEVSGSERTNFFPIVQATAKDFRLAIRSDARPEAGHYYRSDHFSLARVGIPSFSVNQGMKYKGHDTAWGMKQAEDFTAKHYHQPSDEYRPDMDFTGDAAIARFGFALGWKAASMSQQVAWEKGDEFEGARLQSQAGGNR